MNLVWVFPILSCDETVVAHSFTSLLSVFVGGRVLYHLFFVARDELVVVILGHRWLLLDLLLLHHGAGISCIHHVFLLLQIGVVSAEPWCCTDSLLLDKFLQIGKTNKS